MTRRAPGASSGEEQSLNEPRRWSCKNPVPFQSLLLQVHTGSLGGEETMWPKSMSTLLGQRGQFHVFSSPWHSTWHVPIRKWGEFLLRASARQGLLGLNPARADGEKLQVPRLATYAMSFEQDLSLYVWFKWQTHFFSHCLCIKSESGGSREKTLWSNESTVALYFVTPIAVEIHPQSRSFPPLHSTSKLGVTAHPWLESQLVETSIISWHWQHSSDSYQPRASSKKQTTTTKTTKVVIFPQEEMHARIVSASSWRRNTSVSILWIDSGCFFPPLSKSSAWMNLSWNGRQVLTLTAAAKQLAASFGFASPQSLFITTAICPSREC